MNNIHPQDKPVFESAANKLLAAFMQHGTLSNHQMREIAGVDYRRRMSDLKDRGFDIVHLEAMTERIASPETGNKVILHYYQFRGRKPVAGKQESLFDNRPLPTMD